MILLFAKILHMCSDSLYITRMNICKRVKSIVSNNTNIL